MHGMAHLLDFVSNISSRECFIRMLWLCILCEEFFYSVKNFSSRECFVQQLLGELVRD